MLKTNCWDFQYRKSEWETDHVTGSIPLQGPSLDKYLTNAVEASGWITAGGWGS